ncbi:acyltransferase [Phreatobacter cathodiphilus]|uniref:Chloramphenicol acetyltransferase n=1 Tax=Phreatobacter cathodiphilus TaxID=1868589 RepID=A0A2S0NBU8_9HYPH|nr:acyltransferase [Phreatobacter cathodiphilus]AVO45526.1 acyltransferase [Phreatobacter cathodiphilus]
MTRSTRLNADYLSDAELAALEWGALGSNVRIHATCVINNSDRIFIGDNVRIDPYCVISVGSRLTIGSFVHIATGVSILGAGEVTVSNFAGISQGTRLISSTDDFSGRAMTGPLVPDDLKAVIHGPIVIGEHAVIGANTIVLPGTKVNDGATVGALSLVNRDLEPWTVNAGIPARRVRDRDREPERLAQDLRLRLRPSDSREG